MVRRLIALGTATLTLGGIGSNPLEATATTAGLAPERPNILIIVVDDQRIGTLDVMPNVVDRFANEGTEYTDAFVTTPLCCPSRGSIFTGRYTHNHHVAANAGDAVQSLDQSTTLAYYMKEAGYRTGIFGKYFNPWPLDRRPPHFDRWAVTNFNYYDAKFNVQGRQKVVRKYSTDFIASKSAAFIDQGTTEATDPWFLYVAPNAAHSPFTPERGHADDPVPPLVRDPAMRERDRSDKPRWVRTENEGRSAATIRRRQLRTLMSVDDMVGRLFDTLEETGQSDNTLAIFVSDNGYFWGDHGLGDKRLPYLPAVRVPLLARWPGHVVGGATDDRLVANIDIAPTVLEAAGIVPAHPVDGTSLFSNRTRQSLLIEYFRDDPPFDRVPSWAGIHTDAYQYIEYYANNGRQIFREYYDLAADPYQLVNLLGDDDKTNDPTALQLRTLSNRLELDRSCSGTTCP